MTPAEFRCAREYLGLPLNWVAAYMGVAERTVNRWESAITPIPVHASIAMSKLAAYTALCVDKAVNRGLKRPLVTSADTETVGYDGWPPSWHRMLCARIAERTAVGIGYGEPTRPTFTVPVRPS